MSPPRRSNSDLTGTTDRRCQGIKPNGTSCSAQQLDGSVYCFFHDPEKGSEREAAQRAGGQKTKMAVLPSSTPDAKLQNADDAVRLLGDTINQVRRGELDPKIANAVGYLVGLLMKGIADSETERRLARLESAIEGQNANAKFGSNDLEDPLQWTDPAKKQNGDH